jgi:hypothetical protein
VLLSFLNIRERLLVPRQRRNDRYPLEKKCRICDSHFRDAPSGPPPSGSCWGCPPLRPPPSGPVGEVDCASPRCVPCEVRDPVGDFSDSSMWQDWAYAYIFAEDRDPPPPILACISPVYTCLCTHGAAIIHTYICWGILDQSGCCPFDEGGPTGAIWRALLISRLWCRGLLLISRWCLVLLLISRWCRGALADLAVVLLMLLLISRWCS